ncbi:DUF2599 domain-containing protein [Nocardia jinanensis]|uniref:DUF2599 domain-containing protein n=1 Tax=Nocardia jinanensis TaxID=382504 RepID=A0A917RB48_9NOCA|nr:DUF2599 domain-containing protein [Nocardia jinanensis]GGK98223.1 hypothetical protein GCM10011588_10990 [Nocardia jinanensis]
MPIEPAARAAGVLAILSAVATGCSNSDPRSGSPPATTTTTVTAAATVPAIRTPRPTPTIDPYAGRPLIDHVEWTENIDGPRLLIHPTKAGRGTTFPGSDLRAWLEIRTADPGADTPGMWDQFRCHWEWARLIAPDKPTWNLEPWRPSVGYDATVDAACNPGGPER